VNVLTRLRGVIVVVGAAGLFCGAAYAVARSVDQAGPQGDGTGVTPIDWRVTPVGRQVTLGDRPYGLASSPDGRFLLASNDGQSTQSLQVIDAASGSVMQSIPYTGNEALSFGIAFAPDGSRVYVSAGGNNKIRVYAVSGETLTEQAPIVLPPGPVRFFFGDQAPYPDGLAISADGSRLYVANNLGDSMSIVSTLTGTTLVTVPVGHNPYTVALSADGKTAYVSNWGGNSVSVLDALTGAPKGQVTVGTHPSAMTLDSAGGRLYVANSDSDNVSVIDTATNAVLQTIDLAPYTGAQVGASPNALALSPDGKTLYVANAGDNDVAAVSLPAGSVAGLMPTGWYPTGIALSPDGQTLYVANAKGLGAGPNPNGPNPYRSPESGPDQYVGSMIKGTLSIIDVPRNAGQLKKLTEQVIHDDGFDQPGKIDGGGSQPVVPIKPGATSVIKHVIYVIKENRTYDQVFGSLGKGNGDPSLNLFGEESAPNQRALERRFVTLDNLYAASEVSADGWNWSTQAYANTYNQKNWPADYADGNRNRGYDFEGGNTANNAAENTADSFIWDRLADAQIGFRNYGFHATGTVPALVDPTEPALVANSDLNYAGFNLHVTDQSRIAEWLNEFNAYKASNNLPTVEFVRLPSDHTAGTAPGYPTPRAMVADNDLALGKLVDAVSHSQFWSTTAIFVIEDDAQDGPDHVDAHRTTAEVISPYSQTGAIDSTFYSTVSMLRTIELILGISPLTQFDAQAQAMVASFTAKPNLQPYDAITPTQSLTQPNTASSPLAHASAKLDLAGADEAPTGLLNTAIWKSVKGKDSTPPTPQHRDNR
jgi:YVTN family beta-propeller protein